jgi:hypothetical protein
MLKIFKSLFLIFAVATIAAGTTMASFSSTSTLSGVTFAAGTLQTSFVNTSGNVNFTNIKPGDTLRKWVTIENTGTLDIGSLSMQISNVTGNAGLLNNMDVIITGWDNQQNNAVFNPGWTQYGQPVTNLYNPINVFSNPDYIGGNQAALPTELSPNQQDLFAIDFTLLPTTNNNWQGQSVSFNLNFVAGQTAGSMTGL